MKKIIFLFTLLLIPFIKMDAQKKTLVAYFSRTGENYAVGNITKGNTAYVAEEIHALVGGDLFEIKSDRVYSSNYKKCCDEAKEDLNRKVRPKLKANVQNIDDYDVIYLGYPIWWGTMPMPVFSFIEANGNLKGKTIIPFCTHEGSGFGSSISDLRAACPNATLKSGLNLRGSDAKNCKSTVQKFIQKKH